MLTIQHQMFGAEKKLKIIQLNEIPLSAYPLDRDDY